MTKIELKPVDAENFWDVTALETLPGEEDFVLSNAMSIAQAYAQKELIPLAVYDGETPVGFVMYCIDRDDGEYWIYRLMTDRAHRGRGYARAAMETVLARIREDKARRRVFLGVHASAVAAIALYRSLGFAFNGQVFGSEHIMVLEA